MGKISFLLILTFFFFSLVSCGTPDSHGNEKPSVSNNSEKTKPDWISSAEKIDEGDRVAFIGVSTNTKTKEESIESAKQNALTKISECFGVTVWATFSDKRSKINGKRSYELSSDSNSVSRKVEVKKFDIEAPPFSEERAGGFVSYVKLAVPKSELARIQIEVDGFGVWAIKSNIPQCEEKIRDLFPVFRGYGVNGVNINEQIDYSFKTPKQIFAENKKAFYLKVECTETKAMEHSGEFYSIIELKAELFNLLTGVTVNRWNIETKGGAYSAKDAQEDGITKAVQEIADNIK